jgi:hypothetical protein
MSWLTPEVIDILLTVLKAIVILLVVVTCGAFMSFGERRLLGLFQNRYGPNRVGWGGSLQLVADMIKMFFKEDWVPRFSDRLIFTLAPMIAFSSLLLAFAIVPVSPTWGCGSEHRYPVLPDDGRSGGLCRAVRRLVEQQQILAAWGDACIGANPELRSVHWPVADGRCGTGGLLQHADDC